MDDFRSALNDPRLVGFYDYWRSLRGGRRMPARRDVDPLQMPPGVLPDLMLIEVAGPPRRYRYRLVGTHVVEASGEDRTGRYFDEVAYFRVNPAVIRHYDAVADSGRPMHSLEPFTNFRTGGTYEVERLLLPLAADGEHVDMIIVLFQFKTGPFAQCLPDQRPSVPPSRKSVA